LLSFRAFDTWLELAVLFMGLLGVLAMRGMPLTKDHSLTRGGALLTALVRLIAPLMVLVGGYLLWLGKTGAGGAFQAGVVFGVALVLLWYGGFPSVQRLPRSLTVSALLVGLTAFVVAAVAPLLAGASLLEWPIAHASTIILLIESAATVSIALTVALLIIGLQETDAT
jgi:multisubunit Na+/H+ antiporter MnhB subunit